MVERVRGERDGIAYDLRVRSNVEQQRVFTGAGVRVRGLSTGRHLGADDTELAVSARKRGLNREPTPPGE